MKISRYIVCSFLVSAFIFTGCADDGGGGGSTDDVTSKGPEKPIENTGTAAELVSETSKISDTSKDFTEKKSTFVDSALALNLNQNKFGNSDNSRKNNMLLSRVGSRLQVKSLSLSFDGPGSDEEPDDEIAYTSKNLESSFGSLDSCGDSFTEIEKKFSEFDNSLDELVKAISDKKFPSPERFQSDEVSVSVGEEETEEEIQETGGNDDFEDAYELVEFESDDAVAYKVQLKEGQEAGPVKVEGVVRGRYNKEDGLIQIFTAMKTDIDYKKLLKEIFDQFGQGFSEGEDIGSNLPDSGIISFESTILGDINQKSIEAVSVFNNKLVSASKAELNQSLDMKVVENIKGGENPSFSSTVSGNYVADGQTMKFESTISFVYADAETLNVTVEASSSGDTPGEFSKTFKLKAGETPSECVIE